MSRVLLAALAMPAVITAAGCRMEGLTGVIRFATPHELRVDAIESRLRGECDEKSLAVIRDCLWQAGSLYPWADYRTLRLAVTRTEYRPLGETEEMEVWLLDLAGGRLRIENQAERRVTVFDGWTWRTFVDGTQTRDLQVRADALGEATVAQRLATLPFALLAGRQTVTYAGERVGPGETRLWQRLLVKYPASAGWNAGDRTVLEIEKGSRRIDAAVIKWAESPLNDRPYRVDMDEWQVVGGLYLSRRWRMTPLDDSGAPTGPVRYTYEVTSAYFDVPTDVTAFVLP
jgi:hypothetical protein